MFSAVRSRSRKLRPSRRTDETTHPAQFASFLRVLTSPDTTYDAAPWWERAYGAEDGQLIAYFSMEFAVDPGLPIYSGGLGVLAGDHLKAAADLGVPLVGVGLFYRGGYFTQGVDDAGRQTEAYSGVDPEAAGLVREPVTVEVELAGDTVTAAVWRYDVRSAVGRTVPLYLLDVDLLTDALYSGDREHRIRQELLLGVGGVRALSALGLDADGLPRQRGALRTARDRAHARARRARPGHGECARDGAPLHDLHHAHARARGQRGLRRRARRALRGRPRRARRARPRRAPRAGTRRGRERLRVDAARAAPLRRRERRLGAARRGGARDVGADVRPARKRRSAS